MSRNFRRIDAQLPSTGVASILSHLQFRRHPDKAWRRNETSRRKLVDEIITGRCTIPRGRFNAVGTSNSSISTLLPRRVRDIRHFHGPLTNPLSTPVCRMHLAYAKKKTTRKRNWAAKRSRENTCHFRIPEAIVLWILSHAGCRLIMLWQFISQQKNIFVDARGTYFI